MGLYSVQCNGFVLTFHTNLLPFSNCPLCPNCPLNVQQIFYETIFLLVFFLVGNAVSSFEGERFFFKVPFGLSSNWHLNMLAVHESY
jgi:hypothetical protein